MAGIEYNSRPESRATGGRHAVQWVAGIQYNHRPDSSGIRTKTVNRGGSILPGVGKSWFTGPARFQICYDEFALFEKNINAITPLRLSIMAGKIAPWRMRWCDLSKTSLKSAEIVYMHLEKPTAR